MKKAAAIAEVFNAQVAPHLYAGPIEWAANIQLAASIPNLLIAETIETPFHKSLVNEKIKVEDGYIQVSDEAGLGIEVNEKLAEENPYKGSDLHLMMQDGPCDYSQGNSFSGGAPPLKTD
jgi:L-alanine-DL-glutamate epimerase-like enolase superfamily enzyme